MNVRHCLICLMTLMIMMFISACDKDEKPIQDLDIAAAFNNYWQYQTDLNTAMETRDGTMSQIKAKINSMGSKNHKDAIADIDALVDTYVAQSYDIALKLEQMIQAENAIVEYGDSKGLLTSIAKGATKRLRTR